MPPAQPVNRSGADLTARLAFLGTVVFYGGRARPLARRELARWGQRAREVPDPRLRAMALETLRDEHANSEGAAAYAVLAPHAARRLVALLVAYQLAWDYVDTLAESPAARPGEAESACDLLEGAIRPGARATPAPASLVLLADLAATCRGHCAALPSYASARPALERVAARTDALLVTNAPAGGRARALEAWTARQEPDRHGLEPFELSAAAQCSLGAHALLAAAARPSRPPAEFEAIEAAYFPWVDALCTLLDSLVDEEDDVRAGTFSFVRQYPSPECAARRLGTIARRALSAVSRLPGAHRHVALVCALVGTYLSTTAARQSAARPAAEAVLEVTAPFARWAGAVVSAQRAAERPAIA